MSKRKRLAMAIPIELPNDIVEEILVRLPVESLLRFKSVNKSLSSLVENPTFVHKQLHHRRQQSISGFDHALVIVLRCNMRAPPLRKDFNQVFLVDSPNQDLVCWNDFVRQFSPFLLSNIRFVGHCNGLICFRTWKGKNGVFCLWNPFLRQHKYLPITSSTLALNSLLGFGHDPISRDYKIVRLDIYFKIVEGIRKFQYSQAEVYSLRADSWHVVHTPALSEFACRDFPRSVCSGGFCYWPGWSSTNYNDTRILLFDFSNEVFHVMHLPEQMSSLLSSRRPFELGVSRHHIIELVAWNESIAVIVYPEGREATKCLDVWVLDDMENQKLDSNDDDTLLVKKRFTIQVCESFDRFREVVLIWNDEIVLNLILTGDKTDYHLTTLKTLKDDYVSYHATCNKFNDCAQQFEVVGYIESLVAII